MIKRTNTGYTLIEILMVVGILGIVLVVAFRFWAYLSTSYGYSFQQTQAQAQARQGIFRLVQELRTLQGGEGGVYALEMTNDQEIAFYADVDDDGISERVHYFLQGPDLMRGVVEPDSPVPTYTLSNEQAVPLVRDIVSGGQPIFTYYNGNWPADLINNPLDPVERTLQTRLIEVKLTVDTDPGDNAGDIEVEEKVHLRNMKDNW